MGKIQVFGLALALMTGSGCGPTPVEIEQKAVADAKVMKDAAAKDAAAIAKAKDNLAKPRVNEKAAATKYLDKMEAAIVKAGLHGKFTLNFDAAKRTATGDFEMDPSTMSPKVFGEKAVLAMRNAITADKVADFYRVSINGTPPGPGLVRRLGRATFSEGGSFDWSPAK